MLKITKVFLFFVMAWAATVHAQLTIDVTTQGAKQIPIAVVPFHAEETLPQKLTAIVNADLARTGLFRMVDSSAVSSIPNDPVMVNYSEWRARTADAVVIGAVTPQGNGKSDVRFWLLDVLKQDALLRLSYPGVDQANLRTTAHTIANQIYEALTGSKGVFNTRIAYVIKSGSRYQLQVADADGFNPQTVLSQIDPIISPSWAPDGNRIAYVSFANRKPSVIVREIYSSRATTVASFSGSNSAPAWSPDGQRLAVTLTKDGGSQLYLVPASGGSAMRITNSNGIDTEPNFSPDGKTIYFTSDRGGSPQIYKVSVDGGNAQRVTFDGTYNVTPRVSPDGKSIAFIQRNGGHYRVATQDLGSQQVQVLTDSTLDESPSFAPNGKTILYASQLGGRGVLAAVSSDGRVKQRLSTPAGDVREPAWGPLGK
ncbi:MAG: Tol-Pal system beta propeller repeat protein TolB [Burkholderiales bacterium]